MKKSKFLLPCVLALCLTFLTACAGSTGKTILEMETTKNFDDSEPFINEKLIYVSEDISSLKLDVSFKLEGESGILEIEDKETKEVFWSDSWNENVDTDFTISLASLKKDKEYVVRFTGTGISYAKTVITSDSSLVKEKEKPAKPSK